MHKLLVGGIAAIGLIGPASAANLHLFCDSPTVCTNDNSGASQFATNPGGLPSFNVDAAGGAIAGSPSETLELVIAVPTNIAGAASETIGVSSSTVGPADHSSFSGTASLFATPWTLGDLGQLLFGSHVTPTNPLNNYTGADSSDPNGAPSAFDIYTVSTSDVAISDEGAGASGFPEFAFASGKAPPVGSFVLAFLIEPNGSILATPNSETLLVNSTTTFSVGAPEPATIAILGVGLLGLGLARRRAA